MVEPSTRRHRDASRLESLSDGVFAFAATLLVVSLEVPKTVPELVGDLSGFLGFGASFAALMWIWTIHNAYFRRYGLQDGWTIVLNSLLLLVVLFYVYPLKFVASSLAGFLVPGERQEVFISGWEELGQLFALYGLGFFGVFLAVALLYLHANRSRDRLELTPFEAAEARFLGRHYALFAFVGAGATTLALLGIGVSVGLPGWGYIALGPLCWAHGVWSERELEPLR